MKFLPLLILFALVPIAGGVPAAFASTGATMTAATARPRDFALARMREDKLPEDFIRVVLKAYDEERRDQVVALNVLGFVARADYSGHMSKRAVRECIDFMKKNRDALRKAKARYAVAPEVISSLLWVETKHGRLLGSHLVASVYFSLLQADHPEVIKLSLEALEAKTTVTPEYDKKLRERSVTKAAWAREQLAALATLHRKKQQNAATLKGSFAGAFGNPQFIPTSYVQWARSYKAGRTPDLFRMSDAIQSVGHYLQSHGWKAKDPATHQTALFGYNRAQGYVDVILKIADCMKVEAKSTTRKLARSSKPKKPEGACSG